MRQLSFLPKQKLFHGGRLSQGKRKSLRPLARKRPLHLILKAKNRSLYRNRALIEREAKKMASRFQLRLYRISVNFDHVHFAMLLPSRQAYAAFVRALTGILARKLGKGLWALLPFSRVLSWGRDFKQVLAYLKQNEEEAAGIRVYAPRKNWYGRFH